MKKRLNSCVSLFMAFIMVFSLIPTNIFTTTVSAVVYKTDDIYTFGSYPQTKVTDSALISALDLQTLQADSTVTYDGLKYKRVYFTVATNSYQATNGYNIDTVYWFKFEPIQWRVLSNTNGELFVMAEKILNSIPYNLEYADVTWENCTMRSWLKNDFYNTAFNPTERSKIKTSNIVNEDNQDYGTEGGNNTNDKLFLLSYSEVTNTAYGFSSNTTRQAQGTDFSKSNGLRVNSEISLWWLRSPGDFLYSAGYVYSIGSVYSNYVNVSSVGALPALKINLKSDIFTSSANSGCVVDYDKMTICGLSTGVNSLAGYVNVTSGYELSYIPTLNGFGTGTIANVTKDGITIDSYTIVIFGDVNGDGNVDSMDAGTAVDVENDKTDWTPGDNAAQYLAGDINLDGNVDSLDAGLIVDFENAKVTIDQVSGRAESD